MAVALVATVVHGEEPPQLTQVTCENKAFAPPRLPQGFFTTFSPCSRSDQCLENCCDFNNKCRAPLALTPGKQFCRDTLFTPQFSGPPCANAEQAIGKTIAAAPSAAPAPGAAPPTNAPAGQAPIAFTRAQCMNTNFAPQNGPGKGVPTSACKVSDDCLTGCCDLKGRCRVSFALQPTEFCQGNGFSPVFVGAPCASAAEAFGQPILAGGAQPPAPATPAPAPATQPPTLKGGAKLIGFTVPLCRNTDFANLNGVGKVQPTGACTQDTDCQQNCCDGARCRIPFALKTGVEFCRSGFTPVFTGAACASAAAAIGTPVFEGGANAGAPTPPIVVSPPAVVVTPPVLPVAFARAKCRNAQFKPVGTGKGQFTTGPCKADAECAEACCDLKGKCRNPLALQPTEFCRSGFSPEFDAAPERRECANVAEAIPGLPTFAGNNNGGNAPTNAPTAQPTIPPTSAPTQTNQPTTAPPTTAPPAQGDQPVSFQVPSCRNAGFKPAKLAQGQFTTGGCKVSSECIENCCVNGKCRAPLALKTGQEFCQGSGFTPVFDAPPERRTCANQQEALGKPIFANDGNAPPAPTPAPTVADPAPITGSTPVAFTVPNCLTIDFKPRGTGGQQFTTGPCSKSSECQTGCCSLGQNKCRNPEALRPGQEFCQEGFTPIFTAPNQRKCAASEAIGKPVFLQQNAAVKAAFSVPACATTAYTPIPQLGDKQFTESCAADSDCITGCCELNAKICVAPLGLLKGVEFCSNGWTAVLEGPSCASLRDAVGEPVEGGQTSSSIGIVVGAVVAVGVLGALMALLRAKYGAAPQDSRAEAKVVAAVPSKGERAMPDL